MSSTSYLTPSCRRTSSMIVIIVTDSEWGNSGHSKSPEITGKKNNKDDNNKYLVKRKLKKYLGILEADTIKHTEMKEKIKNKFLGGWENYLIPNYIAEISSKG